MEAPFGLLVLAYANIAAAALLLLNGLARLGSGHSSSGRLVLVLGAVELFVGLALAFGARWAYPMIQAVIPANFVASLVIFILTLDRPLLLVPIGFGFATFILYGPGRYAKTSRGQMHAWAHARA